MGCLGTRRQLWEDQQRSTIVTVCSTAEKEALRLVRRASIRACKSGWRARIRTWNPLIQSQVLYR